MRAKPPTAIGAVAVGPWTIAMLLRNPETMLLDTFEDPQFIHDLMRVTTDFCKLWGDAIAKTGITAAISAVSRLRMPRKSIQPTIGAVIVNVTTSTDSSGSSLNGS